MYIHIVNILHTGPSHSLLDHHSSPRKSNIALRTPPSKRNNPNRTTYHPIFNNRSIPFLSLHPAKKKSTLTTQIQTLQEQKYPDKPNPYPIPPFLNKKQKTYPKRLSPPNWRRFPPFGRLPFAPWSAASAKWMPCCPWRPPPKRWAPPAELSWWPMRKQNLPRYRPRGWPKRMGKKMEFIGPKVMEVDETQMIVLFWSLWGGVYQGSLNAEMYLIFFEGFPLTDCLGSRILRKKVYQGSFNGTLFLRGDPNWCNGKKIGLMSCNDPTLFTNGCEGTKFKVGKLREYFGG